MNYADRVVIVTGGSQGIGEGCVRAFVGAGAKVVYCSPAAHGGSGLADELNATGPGEAYYVACDVTKVDELRRLVDTAVEKYERLDCLVNNAGWHPPHKPIDDFDEDEFRALLELNVVSVFAASRLALPHLRRTRGSIVNNGSVAADLGMAGTSIYAASKGAISSMTRAAAIEFIKAGVRVNAVSPGPVETDMGARFFGSIDNMRGFASGAVPAGSPGTPADIAEAVLYLASPQASFLVGQILTVDGGMSVQ